MAGQVQIRILQKARLFVDGLGCMLRDERFQLLEFDHGLFFNQDFKNPLPS